MSEFVTVRILTKKNIYNIDYWFDLISFRVRLGMSIRSKIIIEGGYRQNQIAFGKEIFSLWVNVMSEPYENLDVTKVIE